MKMATYSALWVRVHLALYLRISFLLFLKLIGRQRLYQDSPVIYFDISIYRDRFMEVEELASTDAPSAEPQRAVEAEIVEEEIEELLHGVNCDCHPFDAVALSEYMLKHAKKAFMSTQRRDFILRFVEDYQRSSPQPQREEYSSDAEFQGALRAWYCIFLLASDEALRNWERRMLAQFQHPRKRFLQSVIDVFKAINDFLNLQLEKLKEEGWILLVHAASDFKDFIQIQLPICVFFMMVAICAFAFSNFLDTQTKKYLTE
ncbi:hypothetical protein AXG93_3309s1380 [Marchantia polymorpha subsp. ruderalis]|uniref:Uncharacterized protein n=1 Tax=Marchantia polymorpha subsp. ruderalis TaxID=1480154 RepID=A0A176W5R4_MARPO|nr:hypothetical protein AXG93_3309s1380 [Marchantia polymorpha subsp. ruderalis]